MHLSIRGFLYKVFFISLLLVGDFVCASNYYWIGGSGSWSDTLHWQSEWNSIPGPDDIVIFNSSSFPLSGQSVLIDVEAFCLSMDFSSVTNNPEFTGSQSLNVFGSFILSDKILWNFNGPINFQSAISNREINTNGHVLSSDINFNGDGSWVLNNDFLTSQTIHLNSGELSAITNIIKCSSFYAVSENNKALDLSNSQLEVKASWEVDEGLSFIQTNSIIRLINPDFSAELFFKGGNHAYDRVLLRNNTHIYGSNSYSLLHLSPGMVYQFQGGQSQTLIGKLVARGCSSLIDIQSFGGSNAIIAKDNGDILISFVTLKNITAEMGGGNQFVANHSIDEGANINCNILSANRQIHWVNGTGMWSDTTHWQTPDFGEDGDCIPMPYDDLYFDEDSFLEDDTVFVDIDKLACHHMFWSGNDKPVFKNLISGSSLTIYGSLTFKQGMVNQFFGPTFFLDSLGGQNIQTANIPFNGDVFFVGTGGWSILDSLKINGNFIFTQGSLDILDNYVSCNTFHSDSVFSRKLSLGNSRINTTLSHPSPAWSLNSTNLQFDAGTSIINLKANGSRMENYEGDTIHYHDVLFEGSIGTACLMTQSSIHSTFRKLEFKSNALVYGENTMDTLALHPGNFLSLAAGLTQTVRQAIYPSGICTGPVLLKSSTNGQQAKLDAKMDTLKLEYTAIQDIDAIGDSVYWAVHSNDLGNNTGWDTIQATAPGDLYWVGGTGLWSDPNHWAFTSGGTGGACIPSPQDNVYFDENSFDAIGQIVTVDENNVFCRNMDWTGSQFLPTFDGNYSGAFMRIYSSMNLIPEMQFDYPAFISFESRDTNKFIQTAGLPFHNVNNNVYFNGLGGQWTLMNPLDLGISAVNQNSIYYSYGNLSTQGYPLSCFNFFSTITSERKLELDTSFVHVKKDWNIRGMGLVLDSNQSLIQIDSGNFTHLLGDKFYYNNVVFNSDDLAQSLEASQLDSVSFNRIVFNADGVARGVSSVVLSNDVNFNQAGKVNTSSAANDAVFIIDSLNFHGTGEIYGNDTVGSMRFDSTALIDGNGKYANTFFNQDATIDGSNIFDTLYCSASYTYVLEEGETQLITDSLHLMGNNCAFVYLQTSGSDTAFIYKDTGSVFGDFIKMKGIAALGNAIFDAGYFSEDIAASNAGWLFHDFPEKYSLGSDTSFLSGSTIELCASNFNGNSQTTYEWIDPETGNVISTDSCVLIDQVGQLVLNVYYNEDSGCSRSDTLGVFCLLDNAYTPGNVSCNGFNDGFVEVELAGQTSPVTYHWFDSSDSLIASTKNLTNVPAGAYTYNFEDANACVASANVVLTQPEALQLDISSTPCCFESENGTIQLVPAGGTIPYVLNWNDGDTAFHRDNLAPGIYSLSFTDHNNCPAITQDVEIHELDAIEFTLSANDLNCFQDSTGSVSIVDLQGGSGNFVDFSWWLDGQPFDTLQSIENLQPGNYSVIITDDNFCTANGQISISEPDELIPVLSAYYDDRRLGYVDAAVSGGVPPYDLLWDDGSSATVIGPLAGGNYSIEITDSHGCLAHSGIYVEVGFRIFAPTAFSPNGDGTNDTFEMLSVGNDHQSFKLSIFNRFGEEVFVSANENEGWNGRLHNSGSPLPMEVYTWTVEIVYNDGKKVLEKGNVTLLR